MIQSSKTIQRFNNPFSDKNYYWITVGGENGKRIQSKSSLNTNADYTQTSTVAFTDYEVDRINLAKSGRQFFGDDFSQNIPSRTYINKLDNRNSAYPINYNFRFINASQGSFILSVAENSTNIFSGSLAGYERRAYTIGEALHKNWCF